MAAQRAPRAKGTASPSLFLYKLISLLIGFTKLGITQASEQAFYQIIQSYRIIKMVKLFTQKREAHHQNGTDQQLLKTFIPKMVISCFQWKTREVIIFTYQIYKRKRFLVPKPEQVRSKNNS